MTLRSLAVVVCMILNERSSAFGPSRCVSGRCSTHHVRQPVALHLSDGPDADEEANQPPKHLSAAQIAQREEQRRKELRRMEGFATPGLSSAVPGAQDLPIDVAKTEREYLQSLSSSDDDSVIDENNVDKYVALWTEEGLSYLRMLRFQEASEYFGKVYRIKPEAYLWQDGLLKYYLEEYHGAAESLAKNAVRYESRFMEPASEERIWRDAAELKIHNVYGSKKKNEGIQLTRVPLAEGMDPRQAEKENIASERRKVMRLARQLFSNSLRDNSAGVALARAQLQALCGEVFPSSLKSTLPTMPESEQPRSQLSGQPDRKMYKLHSLFYLGLHYDALGQVYESKQCMKMALKTCANSITGNSQDITYLLPVIHMTVRDWYDDDDFEEQSDSGFNVEEGDDDIIAEPVSEGGVELAVNGEGEENASTITASDLIDHRLRESIKDLRVVDLKGELKKRKLKVSGSKRELQDRLVDDLKDGSSS